MIGSTTRHTPNKSLDIGQHSLPPPSLLNKEAILEIPNLILSAVLASARARPAPLSGQAWLQSVGHLACGLKRSRASMQNVP